VMGNCYPGRLTHPIVIISCDG